MIRKIVYEAPQVESLELETQEVICASYKGYETNGDEIGEGSGEYTRW